MKITCAYGDKGKEIDFPGSLDITCIEPQYTESVPNPKGLIAESLNSPIGSPPLQTLVKTGDSVAIVINDITRATPYPIMLPVLIEYLVECGVKTQDITIFNATGTHRANTADELDVMLSPGVAQSIRIVQNDAMDRGSHRHVGTTQSGNEVYIHEEFLGCDVKILTGFIEPHFFAGFSGGGKAVMPGLAALSSVMYNHNPRFLDDPNATWGICRGNPLWEDLRAGAVMVNPTFLVNVALNRDKEITAVFAGDLDKAHGEGREYVRSRAMRRVDSPFDIVITTNSGYPLDLNLYQAVKGMSAAARITKPGGDIILLSECRDGVPAHGMYGKLMQEADSVDDMLKTVRAPGYHEQDMWQVFIHAKILKQATVHIYTDGLNKAEIESAKLVHCSDVLETLGQLVARRGDGVKICVLPEGPQTIPYLG